MHVCTGVREYLILSLRQSEPVRYADSYLYVIRSHDSRPNLTGVYRVIPTWWGNPLPRLRLGTRVPCMLNIFRRWDWFWMGVVASDWGSRLALIPQDRNCYRTIRCGCSRDRLVRLFVGRKCLLLDSGEIMMVEILDTFSKLQCVYHIYYVGKI